MRKNYLKKPTKDVKESGFNQILNRGIDNTKVDPQRTASATSSGESVEDTIGGILVDSSSIDFTYNDTTPSIQAAVIPGGVDHSLLSNLNSASYTHLTAANHTDLTDGNNSTLHFHDADRARAVHTGTQAASTISDFSEAVDDRVSTLIQNGTGITWSYNDGSGTLTPTVTITQYTDELAQDAVGNILADSTTINLAYNDGTPNITADAITQMSITSDASGLKLSGDATTPGNLYYYGTDGSGTKGYHTFSTGVAGTDGWISISTIPTRQSTDDPTFVLRFAADVTAILGVGFKIKIDQSTTKYFKVTAVGSFSGGNTDVTVYGGTDYDVADTGSTVITAIWYSREKTPFGFPLDDDKWSITLISDTANNVQVAATVATWYNGGGSGLSGSVHIGSWIVIYNAILTGTRTATATSAGSPDLELTLSTANNTESDSDLTVAGDSYTMGGFTSASYFAIGRPAIQATVAKPLSVASKTTYYLNAQVPTSSGTLTNVGFRGDIAPTVVKLVCAY